MFKLKVKGRYLMTEDGTPFYYYADTAWCLFHQLSREETEYYMKTRKSQGFTVIQIVCLSEREGLTTPNCYGDFPLAKNADGQYDPDMPEENYWAHIDYVLKCAAEQELFIALLPTWGDKFNMKWGAGPEIFTPENAYRYGRWIGKRYRDQWNIIWMLGGDRPLETTNHKRIIDEMARGIKEEDGNHLITFHPDGGKASVDYVHGCDYMDFHTIQSSHGFDGYRSYEILRRTSNMEDKPFVDSEPRYEDHPACFNTETGYYWNAEDVRQNLYWNIFEGACGNTYGNHCIWCFNKERTAYFPYLWKEAMEHEGALQGQYAKQLRLSRAYFEFRSAPELIEQDSAVMAHIAAGRGDNYGFVYSPLGQPMRIHLEQFQFDAVRASWFNPRNGEEKQFALVPCRPALFVPPTSGKGQDWILVLDAVRFEK